MQLHQLKPISGRTSRRRGRGGKRGTYSGRGIKGQRARAGAKIRPAIRDLLKTIPKLRGYKFRPFRRQPTVVSWRDLERVFREGETITIDRLREKGLVRTIKGRVPEVKILGARQGKKKFILRDIRVSKSDAPAS